MWCSTCQQDVPAVGQPGTTKLACSRCHGALRPPPRGAASATTASRSTKRPIARGRREPAAAGGRRLASPRQHARAGPQAAPRDRQFAAATRHRHRSRGGSIRRRTCSPNLPSSPPSPIVDAGQLRQRRIARSQPRRPEVSQIVAWLVTLVGVTRARRRPRHHRLVARPRRHGVSGTRRSASRSAAKGCSSSAWCSSSRGSGATAATPAGKLQEVHARLGQLQQHGRRPHRHAQRRRPGLLRRPGPRREPANAARESQRPARSTGDAAGQRLVGLHRDTARRLTPPPASQFPRPRPRSSRAIARASRGRGW